MTAKTSGGYWLTATVLYHEQMKTQLFKHSLDYDLLTVFSVELSSILLTYKCSQRFSTLLDFHESLFLLTVAPDTLNAWSM